MDSKYNSWLKVTNNWNQVCNAGMTYGARNTGTNKIGFEVTIPANTKYALTVLLIPEDANIKTGITVPSLNEWLRK